MRDDTCDYLSLFLNDTPLLDVRAPVEFAKGAFTGAANIALINDDERHQIGMHLLQRAPLLSRLGPLCLQPAGQLVSERIQLALPLRRREMRLNRARIQILLDGVA